MDNWEAWYTLGVLGVILVGLVREAFSPEVVFAGGLVLLLVAGVLEPAEAVAGFANEQLLTIAALFVLAAAVRDSGGLDYLGRRLLTKPSRPRIAVLRLILPTSFLSAFINNTPLVAMMTPAVRDWAHREGVAPSKFLIPLSYAAIIGGACTLIGTSTHLLVSGLLVENGYEPFGMFRELAPVGVVLTIVGTLYLVAFSQRLLPDRREPYQSAGAEGKQYLAELEVGPQCELVGKTVEEAELRHLSGLFLMRITRGDRAIVPVRPYERIAAGDHLVFTGIADTVVELQKIPGLTPVTADPEDILGDRSDSRLYEVVVSGSSPLVGTTLRDAQFRRRYDAVVVAVHRRGGRIRSKLGDIRFRPGDVLIVEASAGFGSAWRDAPDFYLVSARGWAKRAQPRRALPVIGLVFSMVLVAALGWVPLMVAAFAAVFILLLARVITPARARRSVDLSVVLLIASAIGISKAVDKTGLGEGLATGVLNVSESFGVVGVLAALFLLTNLFTELVTNAAAAAMLFPVALAAAERMNEDPRGFAVVVAIAACASFSTPIGYQTNLIVYGPGGYRFRDFLRIGIPLNLIAAVITVAMVKWLWC